MQAWSEADNKSFNWKSCFSNLSVIRIVGEANKYGDATLPLSRVGNAEEFQESKKTEVLDTIINKP